MKHKRLYTGIIMAAAALGCLSSCKKDETLSEGPTVQMVLSEFNSGSTQKTYIGENYVPLWTDNDIVNINGTTCPLTGIDGMRAEVTLPDQSGTYAAVYPAAAVIGELTSVGGSVEIPSKQEYSTTSDDKQIVRAPMAAYMEGERTLYFRNLAALLKVTVYNNNKNTLKVYSISAEAATQHLSGTLPFSFGGSETQVDGDAITLGTLSDGGKQVKLSCGLTGVSIGKGESKDFYLVVAPYTTADKLTFTVEGNAKGTSVFYNFVLPQNTAKTLTRNQVGTAPFASDFNYGEFSFACFSVAEDRVVTFSPGNLQWSAINGGTWRFAEHQWDYVGNATKGTVYEGSEKCDNTKISSTYTGWIDLFGWGTSGYDNKYPYMTSSVDGDYGPGTGIGIAGTDYDWGVKNVIYNPQTRETYPARTWRTLTFEEYYYLYSTRLEDNPTWWISNMVTIQNADGKGTNVTGLIIYPDGVTEDITGKLPNARSANITDITKADFDKLVATGCVFLPAAGYRKGTSISWVVDQVTDEGNYGGYYSGTYSPENRARFLLLSDGYVGIEYSTVSSGLSVRLVKDIE